MNKSGFMEYQGRIKLDGMSPEAFEAASKWGYSMSRILGAVQIKNEILSGISIAKISELTVRFYGG